MPLPSELICQDDQPLLTRVAAWPMYPCWTELTQSRLGEITAAEGLDFATALLYDRLRSSEQHGPFISRLEQLIVKPPPLTRKIDVLLAVAPGAYYRELPGAGGDGRRFTEQAAPYGCRTAVIPTNSVGSLAENGQIICRWLAEHSSERILLASISKGAADIKWALMLPDADRAFRSVVAWFNLSGLPGGSPLMNWLFERRLATWLYKLAFWWKGLDFELLRQMTWGPQGLLNFPMQLPAHIRLISVCGFPVPASMSNNTMRRFRRRIAALGPNDGILLLSDACTLPGLIFPVWGADHNLRPPWDVRRLVTALAFYLAEELNLWADT